MNIEILKCLNLNTFMHYPAVYFILHLKLLTFNDTLIYILLMCHYSYIYMQNKINDKTSKYK